MSGPWSRDLARWLCAPPWACQTRARCDGRAVGAAELAVFRSTPEALVETGAGAWIAELLEDPTLVPTLASQGLRRRVLAMRLVEVALRARPEAATARAWRPVVERLAGHPEREVWLAALRAHAALAMCDPEALAAIQRGLEDHRAISRRRRALGAALSLSGSAWASVEARVRALLAPPPNARRRGGSLRTDADLAMLALVVPGAVHSPHPLSSLVNEVLAAEPSSTHALSHLAMAQVLFERALQGERGAIPPLTALRARWTSVRERPPTIALEGVAASIAWFADAVGGDLDRALLPAEAAFALAVRAAEEPAAEGSSAHRVDALAAMAAELPDRLAGLCASTVDALGIARLDVPTVHRAGLGRDLVTLPSAARALAFRWWEPVLLAAGVGWNVHAEAHRWERAWDASLRALRADDGGYDAYRARLRTLATLCDGAPEDSGAGPAPVPRGVIVGRVLHNLSASRLLCDDRRELRALHHDLDHLLARVVDLRGGDARTRLDAVTVVLAWWELCQRQDQRGEIWPRLLREFDDAGGTRAHSLRLLPRVGMEGTPTEVREALEALGGGKTMLAATLGELVAALVRLASADGEVEGPLAQLGAACANWEVVASDIEAAAVGVSNSRTEALRARAHDEFERRRRSLGDLLGDHPELRARALQSWTEGLGPVLGRRVRDCLGELASRVSARPRGSGQRIAGYEVLAPLGSGGMGAVFLAQRVSQGAGGDSDGFAEGALVALKVDVSPVGAGTHHEDTETAVEGLLAYEAGILRRLRHSNLVRYIDHGVDGGRPWLAMEYLVGVRLFDYLRARRLTLREVQPIVRDLGDALGTLHARDLVHRDVKPENVMLTIDGVIPGGLATGALRDPVLAPVRQAVLIDFGISQSRAVPHLTAGSRGFIAPEILNGDRVDVALRDRADVYGLAATVYTALTGERLLQRFWNDPATHRAAVITCDSVVTHAEAFLDPRVLALLHGATRRHPQDRLPLDRFVRGLLAL